MNDLDKGVILVIYRSTLLLVVTYFARIEVNLSREADRVYS
jgi:hypothetical protein